MSSLQMALYSFGSSLTHTGSTSPPVWFETIANSSHFINGSESELVEKWPSGQAIGFFISEHISHVCRYRMSPNVIGIRKRFYIVFV